MFCAVVQHIQIAFSYHDKVGIISGQERTNPFVNQFGLVSRRGILGQPVPMIEYFSWWRIQNGKRYSLRNFQKTPNFTYFQSTMSAMGAIKTDSQFPLLASNPNLELQLYKTSTFTDS